MNIINEVGYSTYSTYTKEESAYNYILMGYSHTDTIRYIKSRKPVSPIDFISIKNTLSWNPKCIDILH